ncbi:DUF3455 domain-containing protein [Spirosoma arcticum]
MLNRFGGLISLLILVGALGSCKQKFDALVEPVPQQSDLSANARQYFVPDTLNPPTGNALVATFFAKGVQIYEARRGTTDPNTLEWAFVAPSAILYNGRGVRVGDHGAGPIWTYKDGSAVIGRVVTRIDAPNATRDIPWLLLMASSNTGTGLFSNVTFIQRIFTFRGSAPTTPPEVSQLGKQVRIPYTTIYRFYSAR